MYVEYIMYIPKNKYIVLFFILYSFLWLNSQNTIDFMIERSYNERVRGDQYG